MGLLTRTESPPLIRKRMWMDPAAAPDRKFQENNNNNPTLPPRKRVRFSNRPDPLAVAAVQETFHPSTITTDNLDKAKLWYTREEKADISASNRQALIDFLSSSSSSDDHDDPQEQISDHRYHPMDHIRSIWKLCSRPISQDTSDALDEEDARLIIPSCVRGLESGMMLEGYRVGRLAHVRDLVEIAQDQLQGLPSLDMRTIVLANRSRQSSRSSKLFAKLIGEGDQAALLTLDDDDEERVTSSS